MKGITPIIAIIVLLLITLALAGAGWTYISTYTTSLTAKQVELVDSFCVRRGEGKIILRNIGTQGFSTSEITVIDPRTGNDLTDQVHWGEIRDPDLVLELHLDSAGSTVKDTSGKGNDGTVNGATFTGSGRVGGAYDFDGDGDYIDIPYDDSLNITDRLTVSFWMRKDEETADSWDRLVTGYFRVWGFYIHSGTKRMGFNTYNDGLVTTGPILERDTWYHIAGTFDDDTDTTALYVDGISQGTDPTTSAMGGGLDRIRIGYETNDYYFNGLIDEIRIYNRALNEDEINALYENAVILPPGENAVMGVPCTGRCDYRIIMGGRSFQAAVVC